MTMKRMILGVLFVVLGSALMFGSTYEHKDGGLSIWFPDNWKISNDENLLEADAPDGDAYVQLQMLDADSIDAAVDALMEELDPIFKDFKLTNEGQEETLNDLNFYIVEGEGTVDGVKMGVSVVLIGTKKGKIAMMVAFCPDVVFKKYENNFLKIIQSIKPIK